MRSKWKTLAIFFCVLGILFFVMLYPLAYMEKFENTEKTYPESGLSESIFDAQNTAYVPNEAFLKYHYYKDIPYIVDVADVQGAVIDEGSIYQMQENLYLYTTTYDNTQYSEETIKKQLPKAFLINAIDEYTTLNTLVEDAGYVNGYKVTYQIRTLEASDSIESVKAYIVGYAVNVPEQDRNVYLGVVSTLSSYDALKQMKTVLDGMVQTLRYDEEYENKLARQAEEALKQAEREEREKEEEAKKAEKEPAVVEEVEEYPEEEQTLVLDKDYNSLSIDFTWVSANKDLELTLYNPSRTVSYRPSSQTATKATFLVGKAEAGEWKVKISGGVYGSMNVVLNEGSDAAASNNASMPSPQENVSSVTGGGGTEDSSTGSSGNGSTTIIVNTDGSESEVPIITP